MVHTETFRAMFILTTAVQESGDDIRKVRCELVTKNTSNDAEEEETALAKAGIAELDACKCMRHHLWEERTERVLPDGLRKRANCVHRDSAQLDLLALALQQQEVFDFEHCRHEIWEELVL